MIRETILSGSVRRFGPFAEALLFSAARQEHVDTVIRPALMRGAVVICDRFNDSTRAYQGRLGGVTDDVLNALDRISIGSSRPDVTLILDLPVEVAAQRRLQRQGPQDRFEREDLNFHQHLRQAFQDLAKAQPNRCTLIDADAPIEQVTNMAWDAITQRLTSPSLLTSPC